MDTCWLPSQLAYASWGSLLCAPFPLTCWVNPWPLFSNQNLDLVESAPCSYKIYTQKDGILCLCHFQFFWRPSYSSCNFWKKLQLSLAFMCHPCLMLLHCAILWRSPWFIFLTLCYQLNIICAGLAAEFPMQY